MLRKERKVVLGGLEYPLGKFKLGQVSEISVLWSEMNPTGPVGGGTRPAAAARRTIIYKGLQSGGYAGTFDEFENIEGVTTPELDQAVIEVGRAIGHLSDKAEVKNPGEGVGADAP